MLLLDITSGNKNLSEAIANVLPEIVNPLSHMAGQNHHTQVNNAPV
jgi:hypothetical protein